MYRKLKNSLRKILRFRSVARRLYLHARGISPASSIQKIAPPPVIYSLVSNAAIFDSRVMKQAKSLKEAGYRIIIYAATPKAEPHSGANKGIEIRRFHPFRNDLPLTEGERTTVLGLFGEERPTIEKILHEVGRKEADASQIKAQIASNARRMRRLSRSTPQYGAAEIQQASLKESLASRIRERAQVLSKSRVFLNPYFFAANLLAERFTESPIAIHVHDIYPLAAAIELSQRLGAPVIYDAHEIETERLPPMSPFEKNFIDQVERLWLTKVHRMIVCCGSAADFYQHRFPGPRPTIVMNAPEFKAHETTPLDLRKACGISMHDPLIIYTGSIGGEARGLHLVARAMRELPGYHLAILGPRHANNDAWFLAEAGAAGVASQVHLLNPVDHELVVSAIRSADVGICPIQDASLSYRYALPNKLFEMAFAGIPLCVSDLPEMASFIRSNELGVTMNQSDPSDIARALRETYQNRAQLRPCESRLAVLREKYGWAAQQANLLEIYSNLESRNVL